MAFVDFGMLLVDVAYIVVGVLVGLILLVFTAAYVPVLIDRLTPNINEEREIVRGNRAVAEYFGRLMQGIIIGISIIIGAAILASLRP